MGSENGSFIDSTDVPTSVPTGIPSSVPSSVPTSTPTSLPTLEATGEPSGGLFVVYDSFDGFNSGLWSSQCSGCTYDVDADGKSVLYVRGSDQLMVSKSTYSGVLSIQGGFWGDCVDSDQIIMLSTHPNLYTFWQR